MPDGSDSVRASPPGNGDDRELDWPGAIRLFETVYMASRNLAVRTREEYKADITQLADFLQARGTGRVGETGLSHLQTFLADLDARGLTGVTRRRKTASIKAFFGFLTAHDLLPRNPARELIPPEREQREPRFLTTQEYRALLRACAHETRDAAIIELILQTGIRLSEVARLTVEAVELPPRINRDPSNTGSISIRGKGRKSRTLPLNYKACRALKAWLSVRPSIPDPALFVTKFRAPLGPRAIQRVVKKYMDEAGIRHASVHTLRHSFATHHVAQGTSLRTIQEALGHADLKTTSIYISTAKEAMKRDLQLNAL
jgi:integrase/recombinase XerD